MGMGEFILYRNSTGSPVFTDTGVIPAVKLEYRVSHGVLNAYFTLPSDWKISSHTGKLITFYVPTLLCLYGLQGKLTVYMEVMKQVERISCLVYLSLSCTDPAISIALTWVG